MAIKSRANLKAEFETGDTITQDACEDLIDSALNLSDVTAQSLASNITVPGIATNTLSAGALFADNIFSVGKVTHKNPYAEVWTDVTATQAIAASAAFQVVTAAVTAPNISEFSVSGYSLNYTSTVTAKCKLDLDLQLQSTELRTVELAIFKNATMVSASRNALQVTSAASRTVHLQAVTELKNADALDIRMQQVNGTVATIQVNKLNLIVTPIFW